MNAAAESRPLFIGAMAEETENESMKRGYLLPKGSRDLSGVKGSHF